LTKETKYFALLHQAGREYIFIVFQSTKVYSSKKKKRPKFFFFFLVFFLGTREKKKPKKKNEINKKKIIHPYVSTHGFKDEKKTNKQTAV